MRRFFVCIVLIVVGTQAQDVILDPFGAATNANALVFLPEPVKALREVHRVLKPGGRFAVVTTYHLNKPGQTRSGRSPDRARCGSVGRPATAPQLIEKIRHDGQAQVRRPLVRAVLYGPVALYRQGTHSDGITQFYKSRSPCYNVPNVLKNFLNKRGDDRSKTTADGASTT